MNVSDLIDLTQWPAMLATVLAAWLVASTRQARRNAGFWVFLASNALWVVWGLHDGAHALIALQIALAALNIRAVRKTEGQPQAAEAHAHAPKTAPAE
jgi:hypothetical protein